MKKKLIIAGCAILLVGISLFLINRMPKKEETDSDYTIVTSFYPMYVLTKNLVKDIPDVEVINLTDYESGCLHDYQLTTKDMRRLENADLFIMNGGGMESFIEEILKSYPELTVVDASEGISFLPSEHHHDHEDEDDHEEDDNHEDDAEHEDDANHEDDDDHDDHDHGEYNAHVWLDMDLYIVQIENVAKALAEHLQENQSTFESNKQGYSEKIDDLKEEFAKELSALQGKEVVLFHDAFVYLSAVLGLDVVYVVDVDGEASLSAGHIAEVVDEINLHNIKTLFTEEQYSTTIADRIAKETGASVYIVDSLVKGNMDENGYIDGMKYNLEILKQVIKEIQ